MAREEGSGAHYEAVLRLCAHMLGDPQDAEDAAQETFRRALQQPQGLMRDELLWLKAVARNVCTDELRRRSRRASMERAIEAPAPLAAADDANPERVVVGRAAVGDLLGQLTRAERRVVEARVLEGRSGEDIASALGVAASTTRVLFLRARSKMRTYLANGQALGGAVSAGAWRAADVVRRRILGRPWALGSRMELLATGLVVGALVTAGLHPGLPGRVGDDGVTALAGGPGLSSRNPDAPRSTVQRAGVPLLAPPGRISTEGAAGSGRPRRAPRPAPPPTVVEGLLPQPDPASTIPDDFVPSPYYSEDHTVYMTVPMKGMESTQNLGEVLFRSTDGGATWSYYPTSGLVGASLFLPPDTYDRGLWYAAGPYMLQSSVDHGANFSFLPEDELYAGLAPAWTGGRMLVADADTLSAVDDNGLPHVLTVFPTDYIADGPPLVMPGPGGGAILQAVTPFGPSAPDLLIRCTPRGCAILGTLSTGVYSGVTLMPSSHFDSDRTIMAVSWMGTAISHDGGVTFTTTSLATATSNLYDGALVPRSQGDRVVAVQGDISHNDLLTYSDDWGQTWAVATLPAPVAQTTRVTAMGRISDGRYIANAQVPGTSRDVFICSADGATWSICTPA